MLPIYQREAMWLSFDTDEPAALQVGTGKVCAVSGESWTERLSTDPQNYVALPDQPWLDGINAGDGFIRQFVAVPLGIGATVEAQVTGDEAHGGVQLRAVGLTAQALAQWEKEPPVPDVLCCAAPPAGAVDATMGLGAGGRMRQEISVDERPLSDYDEERSWRVFVHLCSAAQWTAITGEVPPPTPIDREAYVQHGFPGSTTTTPIETISPRAKGSGGSRAWEPCSARLSRRSHRSSRGRSSSSRTRTGTRSTLASGS